MRYIYKVKGFKLEVSIKQKIEEEVMLILEHFHINDQNNAAHINLEKLKNQHYQIKIEIWLNTMKKKIIAVNEAENIYTAVNQLKNKISIQIDKLRTKRNNKNRK